jgi:hypothetical protein
VLKHLVKQARDNEAKMDRQVHELKQTIRRYRERAEALEGDAEFLKRQTLEAKRKNKLLKTAITRM